MIRHDIDISKYDRKHLFKKYFCEGDTIANPHASAVKAGYSNQYAHNIQSQQWYKDFMLELNKSASINDLDLDSFIQRLSKLGDDTENDRDKINAISNAGRLRLGMLKIDSDKTIADKLLPSYNLKLVMNNSDEDTNTINDNPEIVNPAIGGAITKLPPLPSH